LSCEGPFIGEILKKFAYELGVVVHACNSSYLGGGERMVMVLGQPDPNWKFLSVKQTKIKRVEVMTQVVEHLSSRPEAQSSIPCTVQTNKQWRNRLSRRIYSNIAEE
jgi:hypothetical protein